MAKKIYVGNLSYQTSDDALRQAFSAFGEIKSCATVVDRNTNTSKGFAFIEFADDQAAAAAIAGMSGQSVDGRQLRVSEANDKPRSDRGGYGDRGDRGGYSSNRW
jgi:RNA recognition motif-containing protein